MFISPRSYLNSLPRGEDLPSLISLFLWRLKALRATGLFRNTPPPGRVVLKIGECASAREGEGEERERGEGTGILEREGRLEIEYVIRGGWKGRDGSQMPSDAARAISGLENAFLSHPKETRVRRRLCKEEGMGRILRSTHTLSLSSPGCYRDCVLEEIQNIGR